MIKKSKSGFFGQEEEPTKPKYQSKESEESDGTKQNRIEDKVKKTWG
jgi:hypothetical protein